MPFQIRQAVPNDAPHLVSLINALAEYEHLLHASHPDVDALAKHLAPDAQPGCEALLAVVKSEDGTSEVIVGMALYFFNYSTFLTKWGIFLEDLFVLPDYRGHGIGFALLKRLAQLAVKKGCRRLDWNVLDWNELAIDFYRQIGAKPLAEWTTMRLSEDALEQLGSHEAPN
jgi:GNAT superfamily N-acetyltransferase